MNGSSFVKISFEPSAKLTNESTDYFCFYWSILAHVDSCEIIHPTKVQIYRFYFDELDYQGFDFTYSFKCSDVHIFEKIYKICRNTCELSFIQDKTNRKQNLFSIEISIKESDRVVHLLF